MLAAAVGGSVAAYAAAVPPPRCRSLCCRLMASALFGMRAAPSRRNGGPRPSSALPLNRARRPRFADGGVRWGQKPARPLRGSAAPPCALAAPSRAAAAAGGPSGRLPPSHFFWSGGGWLLRGHSAAVAPFAGLAAGSQGRGGLLQRPLAAAPLRRRAPPLRPRPPVLAPGRGYFVFAAAGLGIAPPAGGAKGLPGCTRCAVWVRCTWLRHPRHASCDADTTCSAFLNRIALHLDELQVSC